MLPSGVSTPFWMSTYGDRTEFYIHSNISLYQTAILSDLDAISREYRFIVRIMPVDDTAFFYYNLRVLDSWAAGKNLRILYVFFPKSKYGSEETYLIPGSNLNMRLIHDMQFVTNLASTVGVAVWYGWKTVTMNMSAIEGFYGSLPKGLRGSYSIWLDGSFVSDAVNAGLPKIVDSLNITVVTELYSADVLSQFGYAFARQIIVSGVEGANSLRDWQAKMVQNLIAVHPVANYSRYSLRELVVWIFWDRNDGSGEKYTAYLGGSLSNPIINAIPYRVNVTGSTYIVLLLSAFAFAVVAMWVKRDQTLDYTGFQAGITAKERVGIHDSSLSQKPQESGYYGRFQNWKGNSLEPQKPLFSRLRSSFYLKPTVYLDFYILLRNFHQVFAHIALIDNMGVIRWRRVY